MKKNDFNMPSQELEFLLSFSENELVGDIYIQTVLIQLPITPIVFRLEKRH